MPPRTAILASVLLCGVACAKSEPDAGTPAPAPSAQTSEIDAAAPKASPIPPTLTAPPGWKEYRNKESGYRVMAPPTPPKLTDTGPSAKPGTDEADLEGSGQEFRFANCFAQVMRLHYVGTKEFDIETGLDGGIKSMLANINATTTEATSKPDDGRAARQYQVVGEWKGAAIKGLGRGIAVDDRSALIINSFWKADDSICPELGSFFVNSLVAESK